MMKDKILKDKKFLKEIAVILIVGIIINALCFLMPLVVHAAGSGEAYYFPFASGYNQYNIPVDQSFISSQLSDKKVKFIVCYADFSSSYPNRMRYMVLSQDTTEFNIYGVLNNDSHFTIDANGYNGFNLAVYLDWGDGRDMVHQYDITDGNAIYELRNWESAIDSYNVYYSRQDLHKNGLSGQDILIYGYDAPPGTTEFQNSALTGHALNNTKPTAPTITAPSIDSNLSVIENVKILFTWLGDTIKALLKWIIDSLADYFDNLVTNIKAFIDAIITAINNGFMNVYNNIQSLFYPVITFFTAYAKGIQDFIDDLTDSQTGLIPFLKTQIANIRTAIASLVDDVISIKNFLFGVKGFFDTYGVIWNQETWEDALDNSPWLDAVSDNTTTMSQFINGTLNVAEPQELSFTMDFRNAYYNFGLVTWDLSWYQPYKQPVRLAFLSICVLNALVYFFDEAPNFFSGGGSNKKGDK